MRKYKGFVYPIVLIIILFLVTVTDSVTDLSMSSSRRIGQNYGRDKAYYIAYSGLQIIYAALNDPQEESKGSLLSTLGTKGQEDNIEVMKNMPLEDQNSNILGYMDINISRRKDSIFYYKIVCKGKIKKDSHSQNDTHTLTMLVYQENSAQPKIYEGVYDEK